MEVPVSNYFKLKTPIFFPFILKFVIFYNTWMTFNSIGQYIVFLDNIAGGSTTFYTARALGIENASN